jgi:periplasmic divalent cation tolerance protein
MLFKSDCHHQDALLSYLKQHHPYQTPELLVLPVMAGDKDYLLWINASLN